MSDKGVKLRRSRFDWIAVLVSLLVAAALLLFSSVLPDRISLSLSLPGTLLAVLLGFGLPRWCGYGIRQERAERWKTAEQEKWGFHSRDREGPWINYVDYPVAKRSPVAAGKYFYSEWLIIHDELIVVNPGVSTVRHDNRTVAYDFSVTRTYAWDGCTPKRFFYWIAVVGTPDWWHAARTIQTIDRDGRPVDREVAWQIAHHASLVHDALYQYLEHIPLNKNEVDRLFFEILIDTGLPWPVAKIYHLAVHWFGPGPDPAVERVENGQYQLIFPVKPGEPF